MAQSKEDVVQEFRIRSIQEATMRVIGRKGMASATMQEIAAEAGVAKGTLYLYFRDRDQLVEKTFETAITELHRRVDHALDEPLPLEGRLRAMFRAKIEFFRDNREFFRLYMSLRYPEGSPQQQRRQKRTCQPQYQARVDKLAAVLAAAMESGEVRRMNPGRLALFIVEGSSAIIIERVMEELPPSEEDDIEMLAGVVLEGILVRRPAGRSGH